MMTPEERAQKRRDLMKARRARMTPEEKRVALDKKNANRRAAKGRKPKLVHPDPAPAPKTAGWRDGYEYLGINRLGVGIYRKIEAPKEPDPEVQREPEPGEPGFSFEALLKE